MLSPSSFECSCVRGMLRRRIIDVKETPSSLRRLDPLLLLLLGNLMLPLALSALLRGPGRQVHTRLPLPQSDPCHVI